MQRLSYHLTSISTINLIVLSFEVKFSDDLAGQLVLNIGVSGVASCWGLGGSANRNWQYHANFGSGEVLRALIISSHH